MKNRLLIFFFIVTSTLIGCSVTGEYFNGDGLHYTYLNLKKDSSFVLENFLDIGGKLTIEGKWERNKDVIVLNSNEQPKFKPNSVFDSIDNLINDKLIIVQNMDISAYNAVISINNGEEIDTLHYLFFEDTTILNYKVPLDFLNIYGTHCKIDTIENIKILKSGWTDCVLKDSTFKITKPESNVFIIYAQPYNQYWGMKYLVNAEWKFKKNRIYLWRKTKMDYSGDYFLKRKTKNYR